MGSFMIILAVLEWISGLIVGIVFGNSGLWFSWGTAFIWWIGALITGCIFCSIGMLLNRQQKMMEDVRVIKMQVLEMKKDFENQ